jgi:UDP-glucose 4-epimerase
MTTLITGAGLVGSWTARVLAEHGENVVLFDKQPAVAAISSVLGSKADVVTGDILDVEALSALIRNRGVDRILHTAAMLTSAMRANPLAGVKVNIEGTTNVLEAARHAKVGRVVISSSTTIAYPTFERLSAAPAAEDFTLHVISERPFTFYAATKLACEHIGLLYAEQFGLEVVFLRYAAVLGLWRGPNNSIPGRLVRTLLEPALQGRPSIFDDRLLVWRGGEEFIDIRDVASANAAALAAANPVSRVYNVGSGELWSFDDFAAAARAAAPKFKLEIRVEPSGAFAGGRYARSQPSDISAMRRELGYSPRHTLASTMLEAAKVLA